MNWSTVAHYRTLRHRHNYLLLPTNYAASSGQIVWRAG
jgi:hypothetical protein